MTLVSLLLLLETIYLIVLLLFWLTLNIFLPAIWLVQFQPTK